MNAVNTKEVELRPIVKAVKEVLESPEIKHLDNVSPIRVSDVVIDEFGTNQLGAEASVTEKPQSIGDGNVYQFRDSHREQEHVSHNADDLVTLLEQATNKQPLVPAICDEPAAVETKVSIADKIANRLGYPSFSNLFSTSRKEMIKTKIKAGVYAFNQFCRKAAEKVKQYNYRAKAEQALQVSSSILVVISDFIWKVREYNYSAKLEKFALYQRLKAYTLKQSVKHIIKQSRMFDTLDNRQLCFSVDKKVLAVTVEKDEHGIWLEKPYVAIYRKKGLFYVKDREIHSVSVREASDFGVVIALSPDGTEIAITDAAECEVYHYSCNTLNEWELTKIIAKTDDAIQPAEYGLKLRFFYDMMAAKTRLIIFSMKEDKWVYHVVTDSAEDVLHEITRSMIEKMYL